MPSSNSQKIVPHRQTRRWLKEVFRRESFRPGKSLGQHFLVNYPNLSYIVRSAEIEESDLVLEIGAGTGGLTALLAQAQAEVLAVEIDPVLCRIAREYLRDYDNVILLKRDILKSGRLCPEVVREVVGAGLLVSPRATVLGRPYKGRRGGPPGPPEDATVARGLKVVGNLPFNIASATITALLTSPLPIKLMLFTVQEEVAHRLAAKPGSKDYGFLSIMAQVWAEVKVLKRIRSNAFWPKPEVNAAVVRLLPTPLYLKKILEMKAFTNLVKAIFTWRRKTIRSCLQRALTGLAGGRSNRAEVERLLRSANIEPDRRPEDLSLDDLIRLSNLLTQEGLNEGEAP